MAPPKPWLHPLGAAPGRVPRAVGNVLGVLIVSPSLEGVPAQPCPRPHAIHEQSSRHTRAFLSEGTTVTTADARPRGRRLSPRLAWSAAAPGSPTGQGRTP